MDDFEKFDIHIQTHIELYLKEVVQPSFPFIKHFSGSSWNSGHIGAVVDIPKYNTHYKGSDYYYTDSNRFIHYTSIRNLLNILNDGFVRAYDLNFPEDPQELLYAGKELLGNYSIEELKKLRSLTFALSMCIYDEEKNPDEFDIWRLYGEKGLGVGIVFSFRGDSDRWQNEFISRVYYGDNEKIKIFKQFLNNHNEFHKKYKFEVLNRSFGQPGKIPLWIAIFLGFHKSGLYKLENEVRLLSYDDRQQFSDDSVGFSMNEKYEKCLYKKIPVLTKSNLFVAAKKNQIKLPDYKSDFYNNSDKDLINDITLFTPMIEIEKIVLGYRYDENILRKITESLELEFIQKTDFGLKIELSPLVNRFDFYQ